MKSYMFQIGDSNQGPIGAVIRVQASDNTDALQKLKDYLNQWGSDAHLDSDCIDQSIDVYFNGDHITIDDIYEEEEAECEGGCVFGHDENDREDQ